MNKLIQDYEKHFIFNSLNAIKYFCRVDTEKASELIAIFSSLLNYMIFDERKYVSAREEIEIIYCMKLIQEIRFRNEVDLIKIEIEEVAIHKGIIMYIFMLGYSLNILRSNKAKVKIKVKSTAINVKMNSSLLLNLEEVKENMFFKKINESIIDLNCNLKLSLNENEINFDIFL